MYGPSHSGSACCWCVMHVDKSGKMTPGGEGPHPSSNCEHEGGGTAKAPCYKGVMRPGPIQEGWALVGGTWKKIAEYKGPCGCSKKSSKKTGNTIMVRCDGSITTKCATVRPLGGGGAPVSTNGNGGGNGGGNGEEEDQSGETKESDYARAYYSYLFAPRNSWDRIGYQ